MLSIFFAIVGILVTIFFVIGTHEAAHFLAARYLGIKVLRFSIGFGKTLFSWKDKKGTEFVIALIPLGGYVRMLDETEAEVPKKERHAAFNNQPFYKKFLVVLAGPVCNIFCAFFLYWIIFVYGFETLRPVVGEVTPRSIAADAQIKPSQEIIQIDGKPTPTWTNVSFRLLLHAGNKDHMHVVLKNPNQTVESHLLDLSNWHMDELTPDPLSSLGLKPFVPEIPLIVGPIATQSPAFSSPLKSGDKLLAVDGKKIKDWEQLIEFVQTHADKTVQFTVTRNNKTLTVPVKIGYQRTLLFKKMGYLGIAPKFEWPKSIMHLVKYAPIPALGRALQEVSDFTYFNLVLFGKLFTGKISMQSLGGPITIFQSAGDALNFGIVAFLGFLAFLSISIGIINLLPIPGLDGGHLLIYSIEAILGRPLPMPVLGLLFRLGFILLFIVLIQAFVNDILRL